MAIALPLLERAIESIKDAGIDKLVMVIGYEAESLRKYVEERDFGICIEYVYNYDYASTNNIYSLYLAKDYLQKDDTILLWHAPEGSSLPRRPCISYSFLYIFPCGAPFLPLTLMPA